PVIFPSADERRAQATFCGTTLLPDVTPTSIPSAVNTGPPFPPSPSLTSDIVPEVMSFGRATGASIANTSWAGRAGRAGSAEQPDGIGLIEAFAPGSIHTIATSCAASTASTRPATLIAGVNCTSTDAADPIGF